MKIEAKTPRTMLGESREENAAESSRLQNPGGKTRFHGTKLILGNYLEKKTKHRSLSPMKKIGAENKGPLKRKSKVVRESCNTQRTTTD